jgi:DNA-binding CsgD family transcriptional regulator
MTASARGSGGAGSDRQARRLADLAGRLTQRDRQLLRLLAEHHVLTSHQLAELAFGHLDTAEDRLRTLTTLEVVDRFRPRRDTGSAPYHYVLGPLGAAVLAAEQGIGVADLGYRRASTLAVAHHRSLPELVRGNGFFAALAGHTRRHPDAELLLWWSPRRCQATWGALIQPQGFGRWREGGALLDFFLACDNPSDEVARLAAALAGYDELAHANPRLATVTLLWMTTPEREAKSRPVLHPHACLVATATSLGGRNPADAIWLPLGTSGPRRRLADLAHPDCWPSDRL